MEVMAIGRGHGEALYNFPEAERQRMSTVIPVNAGMRGEIKPMSFLTRLLHSRTLGPLCSLNCQIRGRDCW